VDGLAHPEGYMKRMHRISELLAEFTVDELRADEFMHLARRYFRSVSFTIVSSLGAKPLGRLLPVEISPRRVLDPLLWMMEKSLPGWQQTWRRRWSRSGQ
jgi:hypothetical protein